MAANKSLVVCTVALACVLSLTSGAPVYAASAAELLDRIPNPFKKSDASQAQEELQKTLQVQDAAGATANCGFTPADSGKLSWAARARAEVFRQALRQVSKSLEVEDIELPDEISTPCDAEVRWQYVERRTAFWSNKIAAATNKALQALDIDHQVEAERLFQDDGNYGSLSDSEIVTMRKDLNEGLALVEQGIKEKQEWNEVLLEEASAAMRSGLASGGEIAGWDQRLIEFMGNNMKWTMNRLERARNLKEHMELLGKSLVTINNVGKARSANRKSGIDQNIAAREEARAAAENEAFEARLAEELEL